MTEITLETEAAAQAVQQQLAGLGQPSAIYRIRTRPEAGWELLGYCVVSSATKEQMEAARAAVKVGAGPVRPAEQPKRWVQATLPDGQVVTRDSTRLFFRYLVALRTTNFPDWHFGHGEGGWKTTEHLAICERANLLSGAKRHILEVAILPVEPWTPPPAPVAQLSLF